MGRSLTQIQTTNEQIIISINNAEGFSQNFNLLYISQVQNQLKWNALTKVNISINEKAHINILIST